MYNYIYDDIRYEVSKKNSYGIVDIKFDSATPYDDRKWKIYNGDKSFPDNVFSVIPGNDLTDATLQFICRIALDDYFSNKNISKLLLSTYSKNREETSMTQDNVSKASRIFIVHGRDTKVKDSMFQFLRAIGINPIEWTEAKRLTKKSSPYIGEILDTAFSYAQAVLVLLTPDDLAVLKEDFQLLSDPAYEKELTAQARPNVIFEAGMAMGRNPERTIFVEFGSMRPFSDIAGRHVVKFDGTPEKRYELMEVFKAIGIKIDVEGKVDWMRVGDFTLSK